ncbi:MAG: hypothetical protein LBL97_02410 [Prevotellaceae bacterium]|jgi:hypothetical protein|nr:hypothetical protein [Prevotellaceae bacterium]
MKRFFFFASMSLALVLLAGCGKDDPNGENNGENKDDTTTITIDDNQKQQDVYADITSDGVSFTTTGAWTSVITEKGATRAEPPTWITISPDHGDAAGNYTINITLETNLTGADRTAIITIVCGDSHIEISVTQKAIDAKGNVPTPKKYLVTSIETDRGGSLSFEYDGQNRLIKSTATGWFEDYDGGSFSYADKTITVDEVNEYGDMVDHFSHTYTLGDDGYIISGVDNYNDDDDIETLTYKDGYWASYEDKNSDGSTDATCTTEWTGGNLTKITSTIRMESEGYAVLNYDNSEWVNNAAINMDLNWLLATSEQVNCASLTGCTYLLKALDYTGKRSKLYVTRENSTEYSFNYDENGLPVQVSAVYGSGKVDVYTITYKEVSAPQQ